MHKGLFATRSRPQLSESAQSAAARVPQSDLHMRVDRGRFLLCVTSLALGGAAGYFLSEKDVVPHLARGAHDPMPVSIVPVPAPAPTATPAAQPVGQTQLTSATTTP